MAKLPLGKAPGGPGGFNGMFMKKCWHIISADFHKNCQDFYKGNISLQSVNSSRITLVPKNNSPEGVNDFRPISLLNSCLKLLTRILADRLQQVILKIVHQN